MYIWRNTLIILLCLTVLALPGCSKQTVPGEMGSEVWENMPALTYGVLESPKLEVLEWNSGRCEATSFDTMAETEQGYYLSYASYYLYYADKADLSRWLPVCNEPDCEHTDSCLGCNASMAYGNFVIRDNRIYYQMYADDPALYTGNAQIVLMSMAADGADKKLAYAFDENAPTNVASFMSLLSSQHWIYNVVELTQDGNYIAHSYRITDSGWQELAAADDIEDWSQVALLWSAQYLPCYGDKLTLNGTLNESQTVWFRFEDEHALPIDINGLPVEYAYLSGNTVRFFCTNDGYYDMDIATGETVKLAEPRLVNSLAAVVLPNCIVESTLMSSRSFSLRKAGMTHQLSVFDGEVWRDVKLPSELKNAGNQVFIAVKSITSDSIIFYSRDLSNYRTVPTTTYYCIDLSQEEWTLEQFAQITEQWYVIEQQKKKTTDKLCDRPS